MHEVLLQTEKKTREDTRVESSANGSKADVPPEPADATAPRQHALQQELDSFYLFFKELHFTEIPFSVEISPHATTNDPPADSLILCQLPCASSEASTGGISECLLTPSIFSRILETPGFPTRMSYNHAVPAYRIADTGKMGLGMFAERAFDIGDLIIAERLIFVYVMPNHIPAFRKEYVHDEEWNTMFEHTLKHIVDRLTEENRTKFCSLFNCHLKTGKDFPFSSIAATNSFGESFSSENSVEEITHHLVMNDCSRINHSCCPNVVPVFDIPSFSLQFRAVRPIALGEEITRSYVPMELSYLMRKRELKHFGVTCGCTSCNAPMVSKLYFGALRMSLNGQIAYLEARHGLTNYSLSLMELSEIFGIAQELLQNMENEGIQGSKVYCRAVQVVCRCAITLYHAKFRSSKFESLNLDEVKILLQKGAKVTLAHRGWSHPDCVWVMKELQSLNTADC